MITKSEKISKVRVVQGKSISIKSLKRESVPVRLISIQAARSESLRRSNAIVALEGYVPTSFDLELDRRFLSRKISHAQAITLINKTALEFKKGQTGSKKSFKVAMA